MAAAAEAAALPIPHLVYDLFKCDKTHQDLIAYLTTRAIKDSSQFKDIFPWNKECNQAQYLYIAARVLDGTVIPVEITEGNKLIWCMDNGKELSVYGWMVVTMEEWKGIRHSRNIAYVNELTTKQAALMPPSEYVKGIGSNLIHMMEAHLRGIGIDFIKLVPLQNVTGFYKKMGYKHCLGFKKKGTFMCKILNKKPSRAYASYLHKRQQENDKQEKKELAEGIAEIKSQLSEEENELFDAEMKKDPIFGLNAWSFYIESDSDIDIIRELISSEEHKQGKRSKKRSRKQGKRSKKRSRKGKRHTRC